MADPLLAIRKLSIRFGGIVALDGVSFDVASDAIVGLIGPNGAGKTTLFNCVTRLYTPTSGDISYQGRNLLEAPPHSIVRLGITRTFQNVALFPRMSVLQNVLVGDHVNIARSRWYFLATGLWLPLATRAERAARERALEVIDYVGLGDDADRPVAGLAFGTMKAVELARALVSRPKLLLLDEPAGGLNHDEVVHLADLIKRIHNDFNVAVLVVEHHMNLVMRISDSVVCLDFGRKIAEGTPREVQSNQAVIDAYLGAADGAA